MILKPLTLTVGSSVDIVLPSTTTVVISSVVTAVSSTVAVVSAAIAVTLKQVPAILRSMHRVRIAIMPRLLILKIFFFFIFLSVL